MQTRALVQDLTDPDVGARVADATEGLDVGLLIYNAGASDRTTTFLENELDYSLKQIKLDCIGPIALAHHFGHAMRERGRGGIVLVASLACVAGSATLAMYSAVKAFQHNFAEGLWAELRPHGVDVCCTPLGMTYTPAFQRMGFEYDPADAHAVRGCGARDHREHRQRPGSRSGREQPGGRVSGLDDRPAVTRRDDERGIAGFREPAGELNAGGGLARRPAGGPRDRRSGARPGELLIKPLSAAICASDVHYMDHPNSAPRFVWDSGRDTIMGHEFIGEVVGHGPDCSGDFPIGSRVTSMPMLIRAGAEPHVIGHDPDAPGAFGELMVVSEVMSRKVPDGVPNDAVAVVDAFAVGEFYVRCSGIGPGELPLVIGAGAIGLSTVAALASRGVGPIVVSDYSDERLEYAKKFGADVLVNPANRVTI